MFRVILCIQIYRFMQIVFSTLQGNRIKIPPSFCIRQCGEDIFTTMLTAGGNKWGIVCKKVAQSLSKSCICH